MQHPSKTALWKWYVYFINPKSGWHPLAAKIHHPISRLPAPPLLFLPLEYPSTVHMLPHLSPRNILPTWKQEYPAYLQENRNIMSTGKHEYPGTVHMWREKASEASFLPQEYRKQKYPAYRNTETPCQEKYRNTMPTFINTLIPCPQELFSRGHSNSSLTKISWTILSERNSWNKNMQWRYCLLWEKTLTIRMCNFGNWAIGPLVNLRPLWKLQRFLITMQI